MSTRDFAGKPVSADLSFGVVDEAIYSLYPDSSGNMVSSLYPQRSVYAAVDTSLDYYFSGEAGLKSPMLALRNARYRPQLAQVKPGNEAQPRVRKAFPDTAFWAPDVHTDANGHARVNVTFPDSLTTWRATVHAITPASQAGSAISRVLVRKDVIVRMGTPRFLIKGDEITLPVIVHNYLDTAKQATISLQVQGLDVVAGAQQSVSIPSKGEATVLWRLRASQVGTAKLTGTAITDAQSDALELSFPVEPAGVAKVLTPSGVMSSSAKQATTKITFPANTDTAAHTLRIEASPSIAGALFPALNYLTTYPYGCTEQTMSSYLPNVIIAETLSKLKVPGGVDDADLRAKMQAGLDRLKDYQHEDGGWGWWKEDDSRVYMTAYVVSGLGEGAKFMPPSTDQRYMLNTGVTYLRDQLDKHPRMRPELRAAVVYALAEAGEKDLGAALDLQWSRRKDMNAEAIAMTGLAMLQVGDSRATQLAKLLTSQAIHQGDLVSWKSAYVPLLDTEYENDAEATAYAVRLLARVDPNNALLPAAAQWLMLARNGGEWWDSTEQTAMVLFGLVDYLAASHELQSDFTVDVLVNGQAVGQRHFAPADALSGASLTIDVPATALQPGDNTVQLNRTGGPGRVYWSTRGQYYSTAKSDFQAGTLSLNLTRDYYKLQPSRDKNNNVVYTLQPLGNTAQVGDVLAVHEAINGSPMRYLLLEDPIPRAPSSSRQKKVTRSPSAPAAGTTGSRGASSTTTMPPSSPRTSAAARRSSTSSASSTPATSRSAPRTSSPCTSKAYRPPATPCNSRSQHRKEVRNERSSSRDLPQCASSLPYRLCAATDRAGTCSICAECCLAADSRCQHLRHRRHRNPCPRNHRARGWRTVFSAAASRRPGSHPRQAPARYADPYRRGNPLVRLERCDQPPTSWQRPARGLRELALLPLAPQRLLLSPHLPMARLARLHPGVGRHRRHRPLRLLRPCRDIPSACHGALVP